MLGSFKFSLTTAAYQQLQRTTEYRWPAQDRFGQLAALQATGPGSDSITLPGVIFPEFAGGLGQIDALRALASQQKPQTLIDGRGNVMGQWVIESIDENQEIFAVKGAPLKQNFSLKIRKFSDTAAGGLLAAAPVAGVLTAVATPAALAQSTQGTMQQLAGALTGSLSNVQALVGSVSSAVTPAISAIRQGITAANIMKAAAVDASATIKSLGNINSLSSAEAALGGLTRASGLSVMGANAASDLLNKATANMAANGDAPSAIATVQGALLNVNALAAASTSVRSAADNIIRGF